jgi:polysaccharide export outer membrane protein
MSLRLSAQFVVALFSLLASSQVRPGFTSGAASPIGCGDLVQMTVLDTPELSGTFRISNGGAAFLPLVGHVRLASLPVEEAQSLIRKRFVEGGYLRDPEITLYIVEYATQGVSVLGEVKKPGIYPIFGVHHLLDYLALAEGLTPLGGTMASITHRDPVSPPRRVRLTRNGPLDSESNPTILPGDTIFVEKAGVVYVVGDVGRPGGFPLNHEERLTLLQALALAEGVNRTAAEKSAKLIRNNKDGRKEVPIDLKKVLAGKAPDPSLQDDDIVFVPSSLGKSAVRRGLEAAVQAAVGVTIYRR